MRLVDLLGVLPLAIAVACAVGAVGRHEPQEIARTAVQRLWTLVVVVAVVAAVVRLLIALFV